jgi:hypothetical protein
VIRNMKKMFASVYLSFSIGCDNFRESKVIEQIFCGEVGLNVVRLYLASSFSGYKWGQ